MTRDNSKTIKRKSHEPPEIDWKSVEMPGGYRLYASRDDLFPIDGLTYIPDFLSKEEQERAIATVDVHPFEHVISRRQQFWGEVYYHTTHDLTAIQPTEKKESLPLQTFRWLLDKLDSRLDTEEAEKYRNVIPATEAGSYVYQGKERTYAATPPGIFVDEVADQILVNEYVGTSGIAHHLDDPMAFGHVLVMISLVTPVYMTLTRTSDDQQVKILLEPGSMVLMKGEARHGFLHHIPKKAKWIILPDGTRFYRDLNHRRLSLTVRQLLEGRKKVDNDSTEWTDAVLSR
jgi:alkylated DNA repair dioxygenase AlkB